MLPFQNQQRMLTQILVFNVSTSVTKPNFIAAALVGLLIRDASQRRTGLFQLGDRNFFARFSESCPNSVAVQVHKIES